MVNFERIKKEELKQDWIALAEKIDENDFKKALDHTLKVAKNNLSRFSEKFPSSGGV